MITIKTLRKPSLRVLESKNYGDYKRVVDLYDKWDVAARDKDFHAAEHFDYMIQKIHKRNGIQET